MIKKTFKQIAACSLAVCALGIAACGGTEQSGSQSADGSSSSTVPVTPDVRIKIAYGEDKILQSYEGSSARKAMGERFEQYLMDEFYLSAFRNEYESRQIILTPNVDVKNYDVTVSDFQCGDNVLPADAFALVHEYYSEVTTIFSNDTDMETGMYPDAAIPFAAAKANGLNKIGANNNQAVLVTLCVPDNQAAGVYTGTITISLDGRISTVNAKVEVLDYTLPEEVTVKSCMPITSSYLSYCELDDTQDMYTKTVDIYNEFRLASEWLYGYNQEGNSLDIFQHNADNQIPFYLEAAQDPTVPCYGFNTNGKVYSSFTTKDGETIQNFIGLDLDKLETYWKTFIDESVKYEIDVFKKAYVYMGSIIDEPDAWGDAAIKRVDIVCDQYNDHKQKMAEYANSQRTSENSEFIDGLMDSILNVTHVVTTWNSGRYQLVDAFCPEPQFYESLAVIEDYQDHRANGGDYWWYTCVNPKPPYPSIHIDANGVNSRMMYWMMREYDISGYLSWESLVFYDDFPASEGHYLRGMEAYDDVMRHDGDIGDAYYFYPGKVLGLDRPVPSIRLYYMRDGGEDYDAITDLEEKLYPALSQRYGKPLSADGVLNELYGEMYALNKIYSSSIELQHGKEVLNALMVWAANGIAVSDYTVNGDGTVSANIYAPNDATIAVNGATLTGTACGDGKVYQIANVKADAFELEINGRKIILNSKTNVENAKEEAFGFEDAMQAPMEGVTVEKGVIDGKDVCSFTVDENIQNVLYALDENFITAANNSVVLYLYADIPEKMKVSVDISGKVTRTLGTIYLHPGYNALRFDRTSELDWKKIGKANLLILSFKKDESVSDFKIHFQSIVTVG